jgi:NAD(P)-dependent dehydrogenase (short-subunit alcohol dehydrogenase family)
VVCGIFESSKTHKTIFMKRLEKKVAVITGGISGMGLATAKLFVQEGATVVATARTEDRLQESKVFENEGIHLMKADVSNKEDLQELFKKVSEKFGKVDILFANAGVAKFAPIEQLADEIVDETIEVNIKGVYNAVKFASPYFAEGASVIFNTSATNTKGLEGGAMYAASKAAVRSLARSLSAEFKNRKIRVNAVSPGPIATPLWGKSGLPAEHMEGFSKEVLKSIPAGRFGNSEEIAKAALFLASDDSSFVVGEELVVDGGYSTL